MSTHRKRKLAEEDEKAWRRPDPEPHEACEECEGSGMGPNKTYHGDELVDWDDCPECEGTGRNEKHRKTK